MLKRLLLFAMSLTAGVVGAWFLVCTDIMFPIVGVQVTLGTTFAEFGIINSVLAILFLGLAAALWLDKLLDTQLLPS